VRVWRDWVLIGALTLTALLEGTLRSEVEWRPVAILLAVGLVWPLLWRRTKPLEMVAIVFGAVSLLSVTSLVASVGSVGLYTMVYVLLLPYALLRWGSGRDVVLGVPILLVAFGLGIAVEYTGLGDAIGAAVFFMFPAVLGALVRYQTTYQDREKEQVKLREREQLARELHDTVAHHVSAIAVRAQAGQVVATDEPDAAVEALRVIEHEASRALTEMRLMVGNLRDGEQAELEPQRGVADIRRLADSAGAALPVTVELHGDIDTVSPSVGAAIYRLAQESITNAVRHARHATRILVRVDVQSEDIRLTVVDDGDRPDPVRRTVGYGIVGMTERATLLGGELEAGPGAERGWTVDATLPRTGATR
jgi:signal transduction histidine kinase